MATEAPISECQKASNNDSIPSSENVNLRLILVSGKTKDFVFSLNSSAEEIVQYVFDHWPSEWQEEKVKSASLLKLIYHGRFLHGSLPLKTLDLSTSKTTVLHLVTRENLPTNTPSELRNAIVIRQTAADILIIGASYSFQKVIRKKSKTDAAVVVYHNPVKMVADADGRTMQRSTS